MSWRKAPHDLIEDGSQPWILQRAALTPERPALRVCERWLDYRELADGARCMARMLRERGAGEGDVVAVLLESGLPLVELIHAAPLERVIFLLLNTRLTAPELAYQIRDSGARLLIHGSGALAEKAVDATREVASLRRLELGAGEDLGGAMQATHSQREPESEAEPLDLDSPLAILYTSGTSGRPKGVTLSYANFLASASGSAALLETGPDDRWLLCLPVFHVGGLSILLRAVLAGSTVVLQGRFDPGAVNRVLDEGEVSGISLVASMLQRVLDERADRKPSKSLRHVLLGGGPAARSLLERARRAGFPVALSYGLTEAASQVATRLPDASLDAGLPPLPGLELRIVDPVGGVLPPGQVGEVLVRGASVMLGYWKQPQVSAETLEGGWLHTGDLGSLDAEGGLTILDRRSDLIVSGGENVYPAEVEEVLTRHAALAEVGVAGCEDPAFGARPVAWVVLRPGAEVSDAALQAFCREALAGYKVPVRFHRVETLPRGASGKLLRRELVETQQPTTSGP